MEATDLIDGKSVEITGLPLGKVLAALYNNALIPNQPIAHIAETAQGGPLTEETAQRLIDLHKKYAPRLVMQGEMMVDEMKFEYVLGRPINTSFVIDREERIWIIRPERYNTTAHRTAAEVIADLRWDESGGDEAQS